MKKNIPSFFSWTTQPQSVLSSNFFPFTFGLCIICMREQFCHSLRLKCLLKPCWQSQTDQPVLPRAHTPMDPSQSLTPGAEEPRNNPPTCHYQHWQTTISFNPIAHSCRMFPLGKVWSETGHPEQQEAKAKRDKTEWTAVKHNSAKGQTVSRVRSCPGNVRHRAAPNFFEARNFS